MNFIKAYTLLALLFAAAPYAFAAPAADNADRTAAQRAEALFDRYLSLPRPASAGTGRPAADGRHYYASIPGGGIVRRAYADRSVCDTLLRPGTVPALAGYDFSSDGMMLLASGRKPIYRHSFITDYFVAGPEGVRPLAQHIPYKRDAGFSPDGRTVVFSSGNDLWLCDVQTDSVRRITADGQWNSIINGTTDWVYEEEFGFTRAYAFSPDSRYVAFLRFDESRVPLFSMMRYDGTLHNRAFDFKYPKAGDPNSAVTLLLCDTADGTVRTIDTGPDTGQYIPHIGWTPGGELYFYRVNRRQNLFEVVLVSRSGQRVIYREQSPLYIERPSAADILFIDAERFIVSEETTAARRHLYLYHTGRGLIRPLTSGSAEVTQIVGADSSRVLFMAATTPLRRDLFSVDIQSGSCSRLTDGEGWHSVQCSEGMNYWVDTYSSASNSGRVTVHDSHGRLVDTLADRSSEPATLPREFFTWTTERGDTLNAYVILPPDFDPARRYPVLLTQYSGPGSQQVADRMSHDWCDVLALEGIIVACTDGRGTGFRGEAFKKQTYGELGRRETEDQISFARYMASQPYADPARIGIYGWSYGGFMALSCALKGAGLFRVAIAVAPVTSWRFYDSIYTETYNGLPGDNAAGYDDNSPLNFDERLSPRTRLLLIHGTADDNVHFQNTIEMARRLNSRGEHYDMMVYPDQNHSMQPDDMRNVRVKMISYILENL